MATTIREIEQLKKQGQTNRRTKREEPVKLQSGVPQGYANVVERKTTSRNGNVKSIPGPNVSAANSKKLPDDKTNSLFQGHRYHLKDIERFPTTKRDIPLAEIIRYPDSLHVVPADVQKAPLILMAEGSKYRILFGHLTVENAHAKCRSAGDAYWEVVFEKTKILATVLSEAQLKTIGVKDEQAYARWADKNKDRLKKEEEKKEAKKRWLEKSTKILNKKFGK